ncbi:MAG: LTA synthase family protein [Lachnospiraceae bacterium]|nr:LTA synthase family protein [Lachnospiraceae bacterium]
MKWKRYVCFYVLLPFILEIVIESLSRKSIVSTAGYMVRNPLIFIFNTLIIMLTLSIAMFFKREIFVLSAVSMVWLVFGVANFVILQFRVTPFSAVDFTLITSAIKVSSHYFNIFTIAMMIVAVIVLFGGMVGLFRKAPVNDRYSHKRLLFSGIFCVTLGVAIAVIHSNSHSVQALSTKYTNIAEAYEDYVFAYCFANSIIDSGIKKPEDYSEESVQKVVDSLEMTENEDQRPNIIMVQLESFFDVDYVKGLELSQDPIPFFHSLREKYSTGLITVPTVGAGTVNTEFEVLTGMRQHDFGVSEYPYKTILKTTASESISNDLKNLGYRTHAVHNNEATFYGRNRVFANLGFDTFTSMEYMNGLEDNPNGWCKDDILTEEIIKTLDSSEEPDFTMAITVQSHGKYEGIETTDPQPIQVIEAPEGKEDAYHYFVNQLYEVDQMMEALVQELSKRQEKTVLLLYGDHLPSLGLEEQDLTNGNLYQTQYVIWDNMDLKKQDDIYYSYQIYAEVLNRVGIHEGLITKYHQQNDWREEGYYEGLTTLSYDLLYGENYAHQGTNPYMATELQMGVDPVGITQVQEMADRFLVKGTGFTPFAHVLFQGKELETEYKDAETLMVTGQVEIKPLEEEAFDPDAIQKPEDVPNAFVVQIKTEDGICLSSTDAFQWSGSDTGN